MQLKEIKTKEEARQYAKDWQTWASKQNLSYGELADWNKIMQDQANKFDLVEEFKENGII